jgi:hypothetical protein
LSKCWHETSKMKLHQSTKHTSIQPRSLPGTLGEYINK